MWNDLYVLLSLMNNLMSDEYQEETRDNNDEKIVFVAKDFLEQQDSYFQNLLVDLF